jgi:glycosyltransferase involved in cell wall biosynthesis
MPASSPDISIVAAVLNKDPSLWDFVSAIAARRFDGTIELIFVDDCSTDNARETIEFLARRLADDKLVVHLIENDVNLGNCGSRNKGILAATGRVISVIDADCCISRDAIATRMRMHDEGFDVVIGPMGIESRHREIAALLDEFAAEPHKATAEMRLQFPAEPTAFVNAVTRNFSLTAGFLAKLGEPLFDEAFAYRLDPQSGFGWEDVEMGYRLYCAGARIGFCEEAISVHKTHPPEVADDRKALRSARNFLKLMRKHPDLSRVAPDWSWSTWEKIRDWLDRHQIEAVAERAALESHFETSLWRAPVRTIAGHPERHVLTTRWHIGHQFDLWKLPYAFDLVAGTSRLMSTHWDYRSRPMPANAAFINIKERKLDFADYDLAILHFDEFILRPELMPKLEADWGTTFQFMRQFPGPKIAICHGVPLNPRDFEATPEPASEQTTHPPEAPHHDVEALRQELVDALQDCLVVCNSLQAEREWRFKQARTIWHGFDPLNYMPIEDPSAKIITIGDIVDRPDYRGLRFYKQTIAHLNGEAHLLGGGLPNSVQKPPVPGSERDGNKFGWANYQNYIQFARRYGIFFNPTSRSPMPRVRGEAMMLGQAVVTTSNHDAALFIDHGYNGFLCDDPDEAGDVLDHLVRDRALRKLVGKRARDMALELFHVNNYIREWEQVIAGFLSASASTRNRPVAPVPRQRTGRAKAPAEKGVLLVFGAEGGTKEWRIDYPEAALRRDGYLTRIMPLQEFLRTGQRELRFGTFDTILFHRTRCGSRLARLIRQAAERGILCVADFDDDLVSDEYIDRLAENARASRELIEDDATQFRTLLAACGHATCTTTPLLNLVKDLGTARTALLPNCLSDELLVASNAAFRNVADRNKAAAIRIGYASGSPTHDADFSIVHAVLDHLLAQHPNLHLCLIGELETAPFAPAVRDRVQRVALMEHWKLPFTLATLDINVAPLLPTGFNECKSALKFLEAAAVGVPTVASGSEPFRTAIEHGRTGFIANTATDWHVALQGLIENRNLRRDVGLRARDALEGYTPAAWLKSFRRLHAMWNETTPDRTPEPPEDVIEHRPEIRRAPLWAGALDLPVAGDS